jgi:hypothetical protein
MLSHVDALKQTKVRFRGKVILQNRPARHSLNIDWTCPNSNTVKVNSSKAAPSPHKNSTRNNLILTSLQLQRI